MTEPIEQATALLDHFVSGVVPTAQVIRMNAQFSELAIPVFRYCVITVQVTNGADGLRTEVFASQFGQLTPADDIARFGGMLIQVSNLVRQIRALTGGTASDGDRSQDAE